MKDGFAVKMGIVINNMHIARGMPKICTPLTGTNVDELLRECLLIRETAADFVEWRADFFQDVNNINTVLQTLLKLKKALGELPLLFSFRTKEEGGEKEISQQDYLMLNKAAAASGCVDLIDIELFMGDEIVLELVGTAKRHQVYTIISNHDFDKTPSKEKMLTIMERAIELGADLPKIAVMPQTEEDVLAVCAANLQLKRKFPEQPFIMIAMGRLGMISRFSGELFGSSVTFASAKKASAPGQISVDKLKEILQLIHQEEYVD